MGILSRYRRQYRKSILSVFLVLILIFTAVPLSYAESKPELIVNVPSSVNNGEAFEVTVEIKGNTGFNALQFQLKYDESLMECTGMSLSSLLKNALSATNAGAKGGPIVALASMNTITSDGVLATYQFSAKTAITKADISIYELIISDTDGNDIVTDNKTQAVSEQNESESSGTSSEEPVTQPSSYTDSEVISEHSIITEDIEAETTSASVYIRELPAFTDIEKHWGRTYVEEAYRRGIINGYSETSYGPDDNVSRIQFITALYNMYGNPDVELNTPFTDISAYPESMQKAVAWGYQNGIVNGLTDTSYCPSEPIQRQQLLTILYRVTKSKLYMFADIYDQSYTDMNQVAGWAKDAVYWGIFSSIISGTSDTTISPADTATRAQMAKILVNFADMK